MFKVEVLSVGYARMNEDGTMLANGSSSLVIGHDTKVIILLISNH